MTIRTALRRRPTFVLLTALLAVLPLMLAACGGGGGGGDEDATALLDKAFKQPVDSANVDVDAQVQVDGLAGLEDPLRIRATGPYVKSKGSVPKLDLDLNVGSQGSGQTIQAGLLSTGDRVFLKFGGTYYEEPADQVAKTNERLTGGGGKAGSLGDLGLDPSSWIVDASIEGQETIGGVETEHVHGTLDVGALVTDLNGLVKKSTGGSSKAPKQLDQKSIDRLADAVGNPGFDVYVGKDDDIVRRVSIRADVKVPERDRKQLGGVTGASIRLSAELDHVGGNQKIEPPRSSRPLSDLTSQLGGLSGLAGAGALGGSGTGGGSTTTPDTGGGTSGGGVEDYKRYGDCLEQARPDDADAISRCRELLR